MSLCRYSVYFAQALVATKFCWDIGKDCGFSWAEKALMILASELFCSSLLETWQFHLMTFYPIEYWIPGPTQPSRSHVLEMPNNRS
jgi:hypothetical protein